MFTLPADFAEGGVGNVPGVLMKQNEEARGVPLAGLAVKVTNGYFLIGLSAVEVDVQRNIQLLKEREVTSRSSTPPASAPFSRSRKARPAPALLRKRSGLGAGSDSLPASLATHGKKFRPATYSPHFSATVLIAPCSQRRHLG